ncbi:protein prenylyltransferase superfamily protein [Wolffia australiana]
MARADVEFLRSVELRLLRCTFSPPAQSIAPSTPDDPPSSLRFAVDSVVGAIERGKYAEALSSDAVPLVFRSLESLEFADSSESAERFYREVEKRAAEFVRVSDGRNFWLDCLDGDEESEEDIGYKIALVLSLGVAAFLGFVQRNLTGPIEDYCPFPLYMPGWSERKGEGDGQWGVWARNQLMLEGSDVLGKLSIVQYIIYARILLNNLKSTHGDGFSFHRIEVASVSWWLCRLTFVQQKILDNLSSSLYTSLQDLMSNTLRQFGSLDCISLYWPSQLYEKEASTIVSMAHLEVGIIEQAYGRVDSSGLHFNDAERACGLHLSVTGVLGFRTIHQVDAKSQLVLVAETEVKGIKGGLPQTSEFPIKSSAEPNHEASQFSADYHDCDILMTPRLLENNGDAKANESSKLSDHLVLTEAQKAIVLAQCLHIKKKNPDNELSGWEMAPFIEAIDSQKHTYFIIQCLCDLLRVRWESTRGRTKQRALLMMEKLVGRVCGPSPYATERIRFSFSVYVPTIPALRKEYGMLLVSNGLIGEALRTFEELELWDDLIHCYRLLEKKSAAVDLIRARLAVTPDDPRLWCSLGDVANDDAHYHKALEVSNNRSVRAKRSLARSAYNRGDFETSKILWESAMAINSLFPDGWFALGAAALKARDLDKAVDAFTRAVQVDPDNGEAWNNIACLHKMKKRSKESFVAFKEALKFRRNSWQLWENYSHVAFDIGNIAQALEATKMALDLSDNKRVDLELLEKIVQSVEEISSVPGDNLDIRADESGSRKGNERPREAEFLIGMLGNVLQQIIKKGVSNNVWGLYARWHKIKGDLPMCAEAFLKQVRSYQGSDLWRDRDRFRKFAAASLQLCRVYMEIASSTGQRRELFTAEMHLKNAVKQGIDFAETKEFKDLETCLQEIRSRIAEP